MNTNLVDCLIETLNREGINYCHWKSNIDLAQATSGEMDLDFLIGRGSFQPTISILSRFGFKQAVIRWGNNTPGISHFYGYDPTADQLIHVHLFSRVLTGESFQKSHLLPFESMLLQNTRYDGQIKVASKPAELVIFTIRTYIKYGSLLDIAYLSSKREKLKSELRWLMDSGDLDTSMDLLKKYCPVVDPDLFLQCIHTIENDGALIKRIRLAHKVRSRINIFAKQTSLNRMASYVKLIFNQIQRKIFSVKKNKVLQAGGTVIAIVGPDATGKSTLVSEASSWLGKNFIVRRMHAGKPPSTWVTAPFNLLLHLIRTFGLRLRPAIKANKMALTKDHLAQDKLGMASLLIAFRAILLAWDRRYLLIKGRRAAANGDIVLFDRYPSNIPGAMDSPRLETKENKGWVASVYNLAARIERQLYIQIPPPDLVVRLHVSVETAIERNRLREKAGDESDEYIESRHSLIQAWQRSDTEQIFDVDTDNTLAETTIQVKKILWLAL